MQHPNVDLVQGLYAAYLQGDRATVLAAMDENIRWHNSGHDATAGTYEGPAAVLDYLMGGNHMDDYELSITDMLASDERVAVLAEASGRLGTVPVRNAFVQILHVVDGRITEVHNYNWDQEALARLMPATEPMHA